MLAARSGNLSKSLQLQGLRGQKSRSVVLHLKAKSNALSKGSILRRSTEMHPLLRRHLQQHLERPVHKSASRVLPNENGRRLRNYCLSGRNRTEICPGPEAHVAAQCTATSLQSSISEPCSRTAAAAVSRFTRTASNPVKDLQRFSCKFVTDPGSGSFDSQLSVCGRC
jgi:hypothetical protein